MTNNPNERLDRIEQGLVEFFSGLLPFPLSCLTLFVCLRRRNTVF